MKDNNLQARIENARYMGQQHRFHYRTLDANPFDEYDGIDGDGKLIREAFIKGWQDCDVNLQRLLR